jgi:hypothetical protein
VSTPSELILLGCYEVVIFIILLIGFSCKVIQRLQKKMNLRIQNKWVLIPASILTFLLFADIAHLIGYVQRHRCDCGYICGSQMKCHLKECPTGR